MTESHLHTMCHCSLGTRRSLLHLRRGCCIGLLMRSTLSCSHGFHLLLRYDFNVLRTGPHCFTGTSIVIIRLEEVKKTKRKG